ncbi:PH domain-containing protein DDB_G0287875 [Sorghum bicolor]|uniref:DNA replication checkpoint mediator MRC1 domain-containing protein n=1 Tax=Sorghum bicolor TaxID=4558 RepID=C5WW23_SORBI|nr:PH domain-containing protein DDB_G0287875 [Sorghum bicolor]EER90673.1 hypothetical protein SORBI_3001G043700 [Sorghum bicolor]|eukprot:XP_002463675.1 PH domain-containing protein DDB_G0287875 [Sorghum bicolor]
MDTEPFDEAELLALPASPVASPPRRLKRLKKFSSQTTATTTTTTRPPAGSPPPPLSPPPPPAVAEATPGEEALAPTTSPPRDPSPRPPTPPDADTATPLPHSSPAPVPSPLPPTNNPEDDSDEEDDGLDPLFSETVAAGGWDPLGAPAQGDGEEEDDDWLGCGGLMEELRREQMSAKKRLDMDEADGEVASGAGADAKGKRSKRKRKEEAPPKESAREKKRSEKERRAQLDSIHAESQRLLRETRRASFKPIVQPVHKPISSVLEKIRLRKMEVLKKSHTSIEDSDDNDAAPEPVIDSAVHLDVPQSKEVTLDKDLGIDGAEKEPGANGHGLDRCDSVQEDDDGLSCKENDLHNCGTNALDEEISDQLQENHEENTQPIDNHNDSVDQTQLSHSSSPTKSTDETSSEDEEDNDKENMDPSTQNNDVHTREHLQRAIGGDSCPGDAIINDFLDDEAEEEDDSDNDMMRFKDNEEDDGSDENEVFNDLIAAGYEEKEADNEKRNELHQKWLQQQDAAETNNVIQRLKFGHQEQKASAYEGVDEDEDEDVEDCEEGSQNEDLTPTNVVRQNSEKAKQMIAKMFEDDNDTYEHSDDEEIEENLARQRISKRDVDNTTFISPLEDDSSREVFSLIKKLNIAPLPKRGGKQSTSNHEMLMAGRNDSASKSSFLGRTVSGSLASSHRSVYRSYVFGRDDSNSSSRSCISTSESNSDMDQANSSQPKKAKFSSQPKPVGARANPECKTNSGVTLFDILHRTSEQSSQESCSTITESQAVHQFSAFKLSRRFSRVGNKN